MVYGGTTTTKDERRNDMITPAHLVHHHGYDRTYATQLDPAKREAEHARLHEDETAKHLDHDHVETVVMRGDV
jgi:hypothetical protein